jgi:hypothetical protein
MSNKMQALEQSIERVKRELLALGGFRPGRLSKQYNVCGKAGCRCKASPPEKHGPYYQLSYTHRGKSTTRFVRPHQRRAIERETANHARLTRLVETWINLALRLSELRLQQDREDG